MKVEDKYDSVVIGAHPASLLFALRAQKSGKRILVVLPRGALPQPSISEFSGQLIDHEQRCFPYCPEFDSYYEVNSTNDFRFIVPTLRARGSELETYLTKCSAKEKANLMSALNYAYRSRDSLPLMPNELNFAVQSLTRVSVFSGGFSQFRKKVLKDFVDIGGNSVETEVQNLFVEDGRIIGIQILGIGKMISTNHVVVGMKSSSIVAKLHLSGRGSHLDFERQTFSEGLLFSIGLTLTGNQVPPGLSFRQIYGSFGSPAVEIEMADPSEYQLPDRNQKLIFLRTILPFQSMSLEREFQRKTAQRLVRLFSEIVPFAEYNMTRILPDFRDPETAEEVELPNLYPFRVLEHVPDHLQVVGGAGLEDYAGIEGLHWVNSEADPKSGQFGSLRACDSAFQALHTPKNLKNPQSSKQLSL